MITAVQLHLKQDIFTSPGHDMNYAGLEEKGQVSQMALTLLRGGWGKQSKETLNAVRGLKKGINISARKWHTMRPWLLMLSLSHEEKWQQNMAWWKDMKTALGQICKFLWENISSEALRGTDMFSHKTLSKIGFYFPSKRHSRSRGPPLSHAQTATLASIQLFTQQLLFWITTWK